MTPPLRAALLLLAVVPACKGPDTHRQDADDDVYAILAEARSRIAGAVEAAEAAEDRAVDPVVRLDRPEGSLRSRILAGEVGRDEESAVHLDFATSLEIATENARDYQTRRERLYLTGLDLTLERYQFTVQETGTLGAAVLGTGSDDREEASLGLSLFRLFASGAEVFVDMGLELTHDLAQGNGVDAATNLTVNVMQPLLRGFGRDVVREPLTQAERNVVYEARSFERFRRTFAVDVAERFYRLLATSDTLTNEQANYARLTELRIRNEAFANAGRQSDIEVDQARQDELRARNRVVDAQRDLETAIDDYKLFLGLPVEARVVLDQEALEALARTADEGLDITEEAALGVALRERLDLATDLERVEDAERALAIAADDLRAGLDLTLDGTVSSKDDRPAALDFSNADWEVGLELDLPLDRLRERNVYRAALIDLEATRRRAEEANDEVVNGVRVARRELEAARRSYEIQTGAVTLNERRVESAKLNLEAGRSSTRDVLEAQEDLLDARNAATRSLIDLTLARLAYYRDMELLRLTSQGLAVDPGPTRSLPEDGPPPPPTGREP